MEHLETFNSFDLEVLAETKRILRLLTDNELVAVEPTESSRILCEVL